MPALAQDPSEIFDGKGGLRIVFRRPVCLSYGPKLQHGGEVGLAGLPITWYVGVADIALAETSEVHRFKNRKRISGSNGTHQIIVLRSDEN